jgi:uncharacterized membrane protein
MIKNPLAQHTLAAITFVLSVGALLMVWPGIIALFLGMLLLLQYCGAGQIVALSWTEIGNLSIVFAL